MLICFFSVALCYAGEPEESVRNFAEAVRSIISKSDKSSFINLPCVPSECSDSRTALEIIFGGEEESHFERIMRNPNLKILIQGPFTYEIKWPNQSYVVIFYDPAKSPFNEKGIISDGIGLKELYKSFLQMIVTITEGEVSFHRVPFYIEAHHPYVGNYG